MFKNYFKVALRNIKRHKAYSFINISGLAIGMVCCFLIALFIIDELNFDRHHKKADRIYRVGIDQRPKKNRSAWTSPPMAQALKNDFSEIEEITRLCLWERNTLVLYKDKQFLEKRIIGADSTVFDVFTIPFIQGDPKTALKRPNTIVITQETAQKYFGEENPVGKSLGIDRKDNLFEITGVIKNCPRKSHFQFDMIFSMSTLNMTGSEGWMNHTFVTYLVLPKEYPAEQLETKFPDFLLRRYGPEYFARTGVKLEIHFKEMAEKGEYYKYWLQPLLDIYLNSSVNDPSPYKGDTRYINIFSAIALFVLLIACINFMNLSTTRYSNRYKEVGLRKVLGANRSRLIRQFIGESILYAVISLFVAILIVQIVLPLFNDFAGRDLKFNFASNGIIFFILFGFAVLIGFLAGCYPAFFLSAFQPIATIRGCLDKKSGKKALRRFLVVFQFAISIAILISTIIVYLQMQYVRKKNLGFDQEQVMVIHRTNTIGRQIETFKQELLKHPTISKVAKANTTPGRHFNGWGHTIEGRPNTENFPLYTIWGDYDLVNLLNLEIIQGRYFSRDYTTDSAALVINETAVKEMGLSNPIGTRLMYSTEWGYFTIVGVVKDIHFESLHNPIKPMVIYPITSNWGNYTLVKISGFDVRNTVGFINKIWNKFTQQQPFAFSFLDEDYDKLYKADKQTGKIFGVFTSLAILIACLGLFGLNSYSTEQRFKEIGIRKVLGASVSQIVFLLSKEVFTLLIIAIVIASPFAFHFMSQWLQNFAYRVDIQWRVFLFAGMMGLAVALLTVSYQSIKAAVANPVESIKYE
jgi:putative ABC transport system permease protein